MPERPSRLAEGVMEACWLLAVVLAPLYFNLYSAQVFEPDKAVWVRLLALVAVAASLVRATTGPSTLRVREALAAPRMHTEGGLALQLEPGWSDADAARWKETGYTVTRATSAVVSAVWTDPKTGTMRGATR